MAHIWLNLLQNQSHYLLRMIINIAIWHPFKIVLFPTLTPSLLQDVWMNVLLCIIGFLLLWQLGNVAPTCVWITCPADTGSSFIHMRCNVELCRLEHLIKDWTSDRQLKGKTTTSASHTECWVELKVIWRVSLCVKEQMQVSVHSHFGT